MGTLSSPTRALVALVTALFATASPTGAAQERGSLLPEFSWDTVPLYMHVGKGTAFTDEEIAHIARFPLITFEKATGLSEFGSTEAGIREAARRVKSLNPRARILFYWNVCLDYPMYAATKKLEGGPEWRLKKTDGAPFLVRNRVPCWDLTQARVREFWVGSAEAFVADPAIDGLFMDGAIKFFEYKGIDRETGKQKELQQAYFQVLESVDRRLGSEKIVLSNIVRARMPNSGLDHLKSLSGAYLESLERPVGGAGYEDYVAKGIEAVQAAASEGKIIAMHLSPEDPNFGKLGREEQAETMRRNLEYSLALFLVAAGEYSYFNYASGYRAERDLWREWYPEYERPLGPPEGPARRAGWVYTREFGRAFVRVDIEKRKARIDWR